MKHSIKLLLLSLFLIVGCGESTKKAIDNNQTEVLDENSSKENNSTLTGKVIEGEVSGATLFLDLDRDNELDDNEPSTKTKSDGSYSLVLTKEIRENKNYINKTAPLVVYGGKDIRTQEVFEDYLMAIREDSNVTNITPFSTLIAQSFFDKLEKTNSNKLQEINTKEEIAVIKKNLAKLFGIKENLLNKNPIELAKSGDITLLSNSIQLHKSAKSMKKAMKGQVKTLKKSILKTYRSLAQSLRELKIDSIKEGENILIIALESTMEDSNIFDKNLIQEVKKETQTIIKRINKFWQNQKGTLTDNDLTDAIKEVETQLNNDTQKPIITLIGKSTIRLIQGTIYNDAGATASDNKDGDITNNIIINNPVNINIVGTYTVTYDVKDSAGNNANQIVRIVIIESKPIIVVPSDTTKPIITLLGDSTITITKGSAYTDAGAKASDNKDGDITNNIIINNLVDVNIVGRYTVTYDVKDSAGNNANQIVRTINVIDNSSNSTANYYIAKDNTLHDENLTFEEFVIVVYTDTLVNSKSQSTKAIYGKINGSSTNALISVNSNYLDGTKFIIKVFKDNKLVGESPKVILSGGNLEFSNITTK